MTIAEGWAPARAALAGNPSDGYGGAVLAVTVEDFSARVRVQPATSLAVDPDAELVEATVRRFARVIDPRALATAVRWETTIPRSVGLGGSSAIVIATLRALCSLHQVALDPAELARFALAVETDELGIAAGLQDRVAQSFGGLTFMEFSGAGRFEALPVALLPPLVVAWRREASAESGTVHGELRRRHAGADAGVSGAMAALADRAREARDALLAGDHPVFARSVDGSFDLRQRLMTLDPRHVAMIDCARNHGAAANYTGSGGAIVAVCSDPVHRAAVEAALADIGCESCRLG